MIYNPYQDSHGVIALLGGAIQKPNNLDRAHAGVKQFYEMFKREYFGSSTIVEVFWFGGEQLSYSAIVIGPLELTERASLQLKSAAERFGVPQEWSHVIMYGGELNE